MTTENATLDPRDVQERETHFQGDELLGAQGVYIDNDIPTITTNTCKIR